MPYNLSKNSNLKVSALMYLFIKTFRWDEILKEYLRHIIYHFSFSNLNLG